jgi:RNase P subunit RPR2
VRTGVCKSCRTQLTHVLILESLDQRREKGDSREWRCPTCGEPGRIQGKSSERIVGLQTNLSRSPAD